MKNSNNSLGMLIFLALGIAVFVLMALRPAVEVTAMNFGVPLNSEMPAAASTETTEVDATTEKVEEKLEDAVVPEAVADDSKTTEATESATEEAPVENTDSTEEKDATTN